jgi:hypothetical protein
MEKTFNNLGRFFVRITLDRRDRLMVGVAGLMFANIFLSKLIGHGAAAFVGLALFWIALRWGEGK